MPSVQKQKVCHKKELIRMRTESVDKKHRDIKIWALQQVLFRFVIHYIQENKKKYFFMQLIAIHQGITYRYKANHKNRLGGI